MHETAPEFADVDEVSLRARAAREFWEAVVDQPILRLPIQVV
jgi:hypothetical protein